MPMIVHLHITTRQLGSSGRQTIVSSKVTMQGNFFNPPPLGGDLTAPAPCPT